MRHYLNYILKLLENDRTGGYCTENEYKILKEKILYHAGSNTSGWLNLIKTVEVSFKGLDYPPGGWLVETLRKPIKPFGTVVNKNKQRGTINNKSDVFIRNERIVNKKNRVVQKPQTVNVPEVEIKPVAADNRIAKTLAKATTKSVENKKPAASPPKKAENKTEIHDKINIENTKKKRYLNYYLSFPDASGFFWDDKKSDVPLPDSAYILLVSNPNDNTGLYTLYTGNSKVIKNCIINKKAFLKPVCKIIQDRGDKKIEVINNGMIEKIENRWVPVKNKMLQIKIV